MEDKNIALLGFVTSAAEYLKKGLDNSIQEKDLNDAMKELEKNVSSSFGGSEDELLTAGRNAFVKMLNKKKTVIDEFGEIFDVSFDETTEKDQNITNQLLTLLNSKTEEIEEIPEEIEEIPEEQPIELHEEISDEEQELINTAIKVQENIEEQPLSENQNEETVEETVEIPNEEPEISEDATDLKDEISDECLNLAIGEKINEILEEVQEIKTIDDDLETIFQENPASKEPELVAEVFEKPQIIETKPIVALESLDEDLLNDLEKLFVRPVIQKVVDKKIESEELNDELIDLDSVFNDRIDLDMIFDETKINEKEQEYETKEEQIENEVLNIEDIEEIEDTVIEELDVQLEEKQNNEQVLEHDTENKQIEIDEEIFDIDNGLKTDDEITSDLDETVKEEQTILQNEDLDFEKLEDTEDNDAFEEINFVQEEQLIENNEEYQNQDEPAEEIIEEEFGDTALLDLVKVEEALNMLEEDEDDDQFFVDEESEETDIQETIEKIDENVIELDKEETNEEKTSEELSPEDEALMHLISSAIFHERFNENNEEQEETIDDEYLQKIANAALNEETEADNEITIPVKPEDEAQIDDLFSDIVAHEENQKQTKQETIEEKPVTLSAALREIADHYDTKSNSNTLYDDENYQNDENEFLSVSLRQIAGKYEDKEEELVQHKTVSETLREIADKFDVKGQRAIDTYTEQNENDDDREQLSAVIRQIADKYDYSQSEAIEEKPQEIFYETPTEYTFIANPGADYQEEETVLEETVLEEERMSDSQTIEENETTVYIPNPGTNESDAVNKTSLGDYLHDASQEDYVDDLISDIADKFIKEKEDEKRAQVEIYDRINKLYPYLSGGFIRSAYDLKDALASDHHEGEEVILLHRLVFEDLNDLRQFVEIAINHEYAVNVDEEKMIVDVLKDEIVSDGKILTEIFEIANQAKLLNGEYDGYRVIKEEEENNY